MNIDDMVRRTLHSYADEAPPGDGLLDAAQARVHRRRARHAGVAVAAAIVAGLLAISIPFGASSVGESPTVPGSGPPPFPPVELVEPASELPSFPFTPGWTPAGVPAPYVSYDRYAGSLVMPLALVDNRSFENPPIPSVSLIHPRETVPAALPLVVGVYPEDPTANLDTFAADPITLHGQEGKTYQIDMEGASGTLVAWQHEPDQWVVVWGSGIDARDVERYARRLEAEPIQPEAPFTLDLLPAGVELTGFDPSWMRFHREDGVSVDVRLDPGDATYAPDTPGPSEPADQPTGTPEPADPPTGTPEPSEPADPPTGTPEPAEPSPTPAQPTPIEVAGRPAELLRWTEGTELRIQLGDGWILNVHGFQMNPDDLIQVAEGIEITDPDR